jgi:hypothetical protein
VNHGRPNTRGPALGRGILGARLGAIIGASGKGICVELDQR